MPSKRFVFVSSMWSFLPGALVVLLFAVTDIDIYESAAKAAEGYQSLLLFSPIILLLFIIYHSITGFIQSIIKQPNFWVALASSIIASVPFPLLVAFSKSDATTEERLAIILTSLLIFGIFWLSLFTGSCFQYLKIKGSSKQDSH